MRDRPKCWKCGKNNKFLHIVYVPVSEKNMSKFSLCLACCDAIDKLIESWLKEPKNG